jgi:hypothetical protein
MIRAGGDGTCNVHFDEENTTEKMRAAGSHIHLSILQEKQKWTYSVHF